MERENSNYEKYEKTSNNNYLNFNNLEFLSLLR